MTVSSTLVKELREKTGAGIMDCKEALTETDGNLSSAVDFLRKKGVSNASKKSDRNTKEGLVFSYIHHSGKVGVLLEINCETDFVARTEKFQSLAKDITMHIAAADPHYLKRENVPSEVIAKEKEIYAVQVKESGKPENVIERIVEGKMKKFYNETCLLEQTFVKDNKSTVNDVMSANISEMGENISIKRFVRYQLGEK